MVNFIIQWPIKWAPSIFYIPASQYSTYIGVIRRRATDFIKAPPAIISVDRDFNFESLHGPVGPAIMTMHPNYGRGIGAILVKVRTRQMSELLALLEDNWGRFQVTWR